MNGTEEQKTCINCWIEGTPEEVEQLKSTIVENRGSAQILLWSNSNLELTKIDASEKTKEKTSINGKVFAKLRPNGETFSVFVADGEQYSCITGYPLVNTNLYIHPTSDVLHPIKLNTKRTHFEMNECRPANQAEVDLLKKVLYEHDLVWDAEKEQLVERKKREAWEPEDGEICWVCYNHGEGYNFKPMLVEYDRGYRDKLRYGWVFKCKQECQLMCDKLNNALIQVSIDEQIRL